MALTYKLRNLTDPVVIGFSDLMDEETGEINIDVAKLETAIAEAAYGLTPKAELFSSSPPM